MSLPRTIHLRKWKKKTNTFCSRLEIFWILFLFCLRQWKESTHSFWHESPSNLVCQASAWRSNFSVFSYNLPLANEQDLKNYNRFFFFSHIQIIHSFLMRMRMLAKSNPHQIKERRRKKEKSSNNQTKYYDIKMNWTNVENGYGFIWISSVSVEAFFYFIFRLFGAFFFASSPHYLAHHSFNWWVLARLHMIFVRKKLRERKKKKKKKM